MNDNEQPLIEKVAEAPAIALEKTVEKSKELIKDVTHANYVRRLKLFWGKLGPGLTTGAADDDPSGIVTYSQVGARFGYQMLWTAPFLYFLMSVIQEMCARIGIVTGKGLARNIREHFSNKLLYAVTFMLFVANTLNIGADLGAMAKVTQLLIPRLPFVLFVVFFTFMSMFLQIFIPYAYYARYLKYLTFVLFAYVLVAFMIPLNWGEIIYNTLVPQIQLSKEFILFFCAICGTTISPYLFFWQTSQEVEEKILKGEYLSQEKNQGVIKKEIKSMKTDVWSGMLISNIVMFFIIIVTSATLHKAGIFNIKTAEEVAQVLRPLAGERAYLLFALGIIGTGFLAIPVLAGGVSYAFAELFRWKEGLYRNLKDAYAFYGVLIISMLVGLGINFLGIDPIKALIYSAVANGLLAPIILVFIILIAGNKKIMGDNASHTLKNALGWGITGLMGVAGIGAIISIFF